MKIIKINTLEDLNKAAIEFNDIIGDKKIIAFNGEMGAGKTTFIKAICKTLGVTDNITSPTFSLVNEYITPNNITIYHFDCYRLKNIKEAYDIGAEEYFYSGNRCFIEWPERIEDLLPTEVVNVDIKVNDDQTREIVIHIN